MDSYSLSFIVRNQNRLHSQLKRKEIVLKIAVLNNTELMESFLRCSSVSVTKNSYNFTEKNEAHICNRCVMNVSISPLY